MYVKKETHPQRLLFFVKDTNAHRLTMKNDKRHPDSAFCFFAQSEDSSMLFEIVALILKENFIMKTISRLFC